MQKLTINLFEPEDWVFTICNPLTQHAFLVHTADGDAGHWIQMPSLHPGHFAMKLPLTPGMHHFHWFSSDAGSYVNQGRTGLNAMPARQSSVHASSLPSECAP